jgi:pimeloyl-ACP methyl ester carboxylesterase
MPGDEKERMLHHPDRNESKTTVKNATVRTLSAEWQTLAVETQLEIDEATWRWWLLEGMNYAIADQVGHITVPITVFASDDDPVIDQGAIQREVMEVLPSAQLVRTRGVGHLLPLEDPVWVADQIRRICR